MVVPVRVWLLSLGLLMVVVEVVLLRLRLCLHLSVEGLLHVDALIGAGVKVHILHIHNISRPGQREIGCCSGGGAGFDGATSKTNWSRSCSSVPPDPQRTRQDGAFKLWREARRRGELRNERLTVGGETKGWQPSWVRDGGTGKSVVGRSEDFHQIQSKKGGNGRREEAGSLSDLRLDERGDPGVVGSLESEGQSLSQSQTRW